MSWYGRFDACSTERECSLFAEFKRRRPIGSWEFVFADIFFFYIFGSDWKLECGTTSSASTTTKL